MASDLQIDPDPPYHFDADPDPAFQFVADPDPQTGLGTSRKIPPPLSRTPLYPEPVQKDRSCNPTLTVLCTVFMSIVQGQGNTM